jgi:hypothetical protein
VVIQPAPPVVVQPRTPPVIVQPQPSPVVVQPPAASGSTVVVAPGNPAPQTILANDIKAHEVRAQTIYANKIKARAVEGTIHQTKRVDLGSGKEDVKAPLVTASVIYADEIEAERVVAGDIYVRDLDRN